MDGGARRSAHAGRRERAVHQQQERVAEPSRVVDPGVGGEVTETRSNCLFVGEGGAVGRVLGLGELGGGDLKRAAEACRTVQTA